LKPFRPFFQHPHLATLAGNFWPREFDRSGYDSRLVEYETDPGVRILVEEDRPRGSSLGEVLLQHGLEGSSRSGYMISLSHALCTAGFTVHRVNMRGCGGSEPLSASLYHSGLTHDLLFLLNHLRDHGRGPRLLCGFSLGGNVVLKLAGQLPEMVAGTMSPPKMVAGTFSGLVQAVAAVSTPIDLAACVRALSSRSNWIYERKFVRSLKARYRRRHAAYPDLFPLDGLDRVRTIYEFDDLVTARAFGFGTADRYYATQSSWQFIRKIDRPTLMIQAVDDPLIPFEIYESAEIRSNPRVELVAVPHGGHLGFVARKPDRFWLDVVLREWISGLVRNKPAHTAV
jgi:hypothetical protein